MLTLLYVLLWLLGLHDIIPDNLLSLFDENELEVCHHVLSMYVITTLHLPTSTFHTLCSSHLITLIHLQCHLLLFLLLLLIPLVYTHSSSPTLFQLLMCGLSTVSFTDLKQNARVIRADATFRNVVSWFWTMVSSFTQEEMAKMLQFVTGCSQLPPGGFKELHPPFTITHAPTHGRLPTAHTW